MAAGAEERRVAEAVQQYSDDRTQRDRADPIGEDRAGCGPGAHRLDRDPRHEEGADTRKQPTHHEIRGGARESAAVLPDGRSASQAVEENGDETEAANDVAERMADTVGCQ